MTDLIDSTGDWVVAAGQQPRTPTPDAKQVAFYTGMQLEELAEKLEAFGFSFAKEMHEVADRFKRGGNDTIVALALDQPDIAKQVLDAEVDLMWVTIGAARAAGSDVQGAYRAVNVANWAKFPNGVASLDPVTRKVLKPAGWTAADLTQFVHPNLRGASE